MLVKAGKLSIVEDGLLDWLGVVGLRGNGGDRDNIAEIELGKILCGFQAGLVQGWI